MNGAVYCVSVLVYLAVILFVFLQHRGLKLDTSSFRDFNKILIISAIFVFVDFCRGLFMGGIIKQSSALSGLTYIFHISVILMAYSWYRYTIRYLLADDVPAFKIIAVIPALCTALLLVMNKRNSLLFRVDRYSEYHAGRLRWVLYLCEYLYFILSAVVVLIRLRSENDEFKKHRLKVVFSYLLILLITGLLQLITTAIPWYSVGCMFASLVAFIGNVMIDRENELREKYNMSVSENTEMNDAMEALAGAYSAIHLFSFDDNIAHTIRASQTVESIAETEESADAKIKATMKGLVDESMVKDMLRFVDFTTLPVRLKGKRMISREFLDVKGRWCLSSFIVAKSDVSGNPEKVIHAVQNIDDAKRKEMEYQAALKEALENQNVIYSEMLKMQAGGIIALGADGEIMLANDAAARIFGYPDASEIKGFYKDILDKTRIDDKESLIKDSHRVVNYGGEFSYSFSTEDVTGKTVYILANARRFELNSGKSVLITSYTDITKNKEMEKKLQIISETDALTGINNRGSGEQKTILALARGESGMFCLIDVNNFKSINDNYGHQTGDKALIAIARALSSSFRDEDVVMRLGGDEFAVFAKSVNEKKIGEDCIGRFFDNVEAIDIEELQGRKITVSLGAVFSESLDDKSFSSIYNKADSVMYLCKDHKEVSTMAFYEVH